jgi:ribonuclease BN (tRNA processing enzyme)
VRLRVLGSAGGIGGHRRTTSFLLDEDILIDGGTGVGDLTLEEMTRLRKVFVSHAHLDHLAGLLLLLDSVHALSYGTLVVHGLAHTLEVFSKHLLNDEIWPDFRRIPSERDPILSLEPISPGESVRDRGRAFTLIEVRHTVPAAGYLITGPEGAIAFTGDTGPSPGFWRALNESRRLDLLLVEVSFPDSRAELARRTGHHHPASLAEDLERLVHRPKIWLTHLKPGLEEEIEADCRRALGSRDFQIARAGEVFSF